MEEGSNLSESNGRRRDIRSHSSQQRNEMGGDRFSCLPESLLLHIVSFLDAEDAGKTSILSRRWRDLWTHTDTLNFSSGDIVENDKYLRTVDRCLLLHQASKLKRFRLCCSFEMSYASHFDAWIRFAMRKGVEELDLELSSSELHGIKYELPRWIFKCRSLRLLKLTYCIVKLPASLDLPSLKILSLSNIKELTDNLIHELLAGCPQLEDLNISCCGGDLSFRISSVQLKRLVIQHYYFEGLEIHAPNLLSLEISGNVYGDNYFLKNLSSLLYVDLGIVFFFETDEDMRHHYILEKLLKDLHHTKVLKLSSFCVQVLSVWEWRKVPAPLFEWKCLILSTGLRYWELPGIARILRSSPDLETLIIKFSYDFPPCPDDDSYDMIVGEFMEAYNFSERDYWESHESSFPCLVHCLKNVTIFGLIAEEAEDSLALQKGGTNLVKFLLKNTMVLEKMKIYCEVISWKKQEVLTFPRASSRGEIFFSS